MKYIESNNIVIYNMYKNYLLKIRIVLYFKYYMNIEK